MINVIWPKAYDYHGADGKEAPTEMQRAFLFHFFISRTPKKMKYFYEIKMDPFYYRELPKIRAFHIRFSKNISLFGQK